MCAHSCSCDMSENMYIGKSSVNTPWLLLVLSPQALPPVSPSTHHQRLALQYHTECLAHTHPACCLLCLLRLSLPAAGSAAVAFGCSAAPHSTKQPLTNLDSMSVTDSLSGSAHPSGPQQELRCAVLGLLDGTLCCIAVTGAAQRSRCGTQDGSSSRQQPSLDPIRLQDSTSRLGVLQQPPQQPALHPSHQPHQQQQQQQLKLSVLWQVKGTAPIFSSPVIDAQQGLVVSAAVDGVVTGLDLLTGRQVWKVQLGGQIFADLLLLQQQQPSVQGQMGPQADAVPVSVLPQQQQLGEEVVVVATKAGEVVGLDTKQGSKVRAVQPSECRGAPWAECLAVSLAVLAVASLLHLV